MDWKQRWQWIRRSLWIIRWMKLLHILSRKSQMEITHPIKALSHIFKNYRSVFYLLQTLWSKGKTLSLLWSGPLGCGFYQSKPHSPFPASAVASSGLLCFWALVQTPTGMIQLLPRPLTLFRHILFREASVAHSSVLLLSPSQHCGHWISHCTPSDWASICFMSIFLYP